MKHWYVAALLVVLLGGCQSTSKKAEPRYIDALVAKDGSVVSVAQLGQAIKDNDYVKALSRYRAQTERSDDVKKRYRELWLAYGETSYLSELGQFREDFTAEYAKLERDNISCDSLDWQRYQVALFFSLDFNSKAQACYESVGNTQQAQYYGDTVAFILTGLFAVSDGRSPYSALEVPSYIDADAIVTLTGYEVVDSFIDLGADGAGLYYVFILNDPSSNEQFWLYFDYERYLHRLAELDYPFGWMTNTFIDDYVVPFAKTSTSFKIALSRELILNNRVDEAIEQLLEAAAQGSVIANYRLAEICRFRQNTLLRDDECFDFYLRSAEQGLAEGLTAMAQMLHQGTEVARDMASFEQLMQAAQVKLPTGGAWFDVAQQAKKSNDDASFEYAIKRAADEGSLHAQYHNRLKQLRLTAKEDEQLAQKLLLQLNEQVNNSDEVVKTLYAELLLSMEYLDTAYIAELLLSAADSGHPDSNRLLGDMYANGIHFTKDDNKAKQYYGMAAVKYDLTAQYKLALLYNKTNRQLAASWFRMCRFKSGYDCFYRMAIAAKDGFIKGMGMAQAIGFLQVLEQQKHGLGMATLAEIYDEEGKSYSDKAKAFELTVEALALNVPWAYYRMCRYYAQGSVDPYIPMSVKKATENCKIASEQGIDAATELLKSL